MTIHCECTGIKKILLCVNLGHLHSLLCCSVMILSILFREYMEDACACGTVCVYICVGTLQCMCVCIYIYIQIYIFRYIHVCNLCMCVHVCMYYVYIEYREYILLGTNFELFFGVGDL